MMIIIIIIIIIIIPFILFIHCSLSKYFLFIVSVLFLTSLYHLVSMFYIINHLFYSFTVLSASSVTLVHVVVLLLCFC